MRLFLSCLFVCICLPAAVPAAPEKLAWHAWSQDVFAQAKREHRFVLLDLEAVWCHWCHVMDVTTYRDPKVVNLLNSKYLLVKADQDSRPDLSNRYEDFGWPATVVFDGDGQEIVKRQGYLNPQEMASMLQAIIDDPSPGPSVEPEQKTTFPANPLLGNDLRAEMQKDYLGGYDSKQGSWGFNQKFLDWDSVEYAMDLAAHGDAQAEHMARQTLTAQLQLLDPVWGGVYQYSTDGVWTSPHFEKIMSMQAENLRIFSQAYAQFGDPAYLAAAQSIRTYLKTFLTSSDGAFYTSQDADLVEGQHSAEYFRLDDQARRKLGVPRVDKHIYARENGWAITGMVALYAATGDRSALDEAVHAAQWIELHRSMVGGGFRHDAKDLAGPYLGDTISMARAFLALYGATGERKWLAASERSAQFIDSKFRNSKGAGYVTAASNTDPAYRAHPQRDENVSVARITNLLSFYSGNAKFHAMSVFAMRFLAAPSVATKLPVGSVLLADFELTRPPVHLTIVGSKGDAQAKLLFQAALRYPATYKRLEWLDAAEGRLPNPDVQYPTSARAAAYVCTDRTCSPPIFKAEELAAKVSRISGLQKHEATENTLEPKRAFSRLWLQSAAGAVGIYALKPLFVVIFAGPGSLMGVR